MAARKDVFKNYRYIWPKGSKRKCGVHTKIMNKIKKLHLGPRAVSLLGDPRANGIVYW